MTAIEILKKHYNLVKEKHPEKNWVEFHNNPIEVGFIIDAMQEYANQRLEALATRHNLAKRAIAAVKAEMKLQQINRYMISFHTKRDTRPRTIMLTIEMNSLPQRDPDLANFMLQACAKKVATDTGILTPPSDIVIALPLLLDIEYKFETETNPAPTSAG